ncbi:MAG: hypothetical protein ABI837_03465 [Acidobacteriota bacterium]
MRLLSVIGILAVGLMSALPVVAQGRPDNVVVTRGGSNELLIPAAASAQGANGTFFRSEINILNYTSRTQRIRMRWLPNGQPASTDTVDVTLGAFQGLSSDDFVATILHKSGVGAIIATGVTPDGSLVDGTARLYATDRVWTPQPGSTGTVSQSFSVLQTNELNGGKSMSLIGLRRDEGFRVNAGIVNLAFSPQTFQVVVAGRNPTLIAETYTLTVGAESMAQFNMPGIAQPDLQIVITNITAAATLSNKWVGYGSSVDNVTGDSWSELAFVPNIDTAP